MYEVNAYKLTLERDRETLLYLKPLSQSQNQDFQKYKKPKKRKRFSDAEYVEEKKKPNLLKRLCLKAFCQKASDSGDSDISQPLDAKECQGTQMENYELAKGCFNL